MQVSSWPSRTRVPYQKIHVPPEYAFSHFCAQRIAKRRCELGHHICRRVYRSQILNPSKQPGLQQIFAPRKSFAASQYVSTGPRNRHSSQVFAGSRFLGQCRTILKLLYQLLATTLDVMNKEERRQEREHMLSVVSWISVTTSDVQAKEPNSTTKFMLLLIEESPEVVIRAITHVRVERMTASDMMLREN